MVVHGEWFKDRGLYCHISRWLYYCLVVLISKAGNSTLQETTVILPAETWEITPVYQNSDSTALWIHPYIREYCASLSAVRRDWTACNDLQQIWNIWVQFWTTQFVMYVYNQMAKLYVNRPATDLKSVVLFTEAVNQVQPHIHKSCISGFKAADYKSRTYLILMHSKGTWARNFSTCGYFYPSWLQIHYRASHPNKLKFDGFKVKIIWNYSNSCSSTDLYKGDSDPGLMIVSVSNWLPQALE